MNNDDSTVVAVWKIKGVKKMLEVCQTSDVFADTDNDNLFFVLANELSEAIDLLEEKPSTK